jgi:hypothetical protein
VTDFDFMNGRRLRIDAGRSNVNVTLAAGTGVHRLSLAARFTSRNLPPGLPVQFTGDLYLDLHDAQQWIGPLHALPVPVRELGAPCQLTAGVTDHQLLSIEKLRAGRDLGLAFHPTAVLLQPLDDIWPVNQAEVHIAVQAGNWAWQLDGLGAASFTEVLVPLPFDAGETRQAANRLRQARAHVADGNYEDAVRTARLALDYVKRTVPHDPKVFSVTSRRRTLDQRRDVLTEALFSIASGPNHDDEVTKDFIYGRDDAVMVIAAIAGLLGRLQQHRQRQARLFSRSWECPGRARCRLRRVPPRARTRSGGENAAEIHGGAACGSGGETALERQQVNRLAAGSPPRSAFAGGGSPRSGARAIAIRRKRLARIRSRA